MPTIPAIFWTTLIALCALLGVATLLGRLYGELFPCRLSAAARFYLSPVLGLATLTVMASLVGHVLPLGNAVIVPVLVAGLAVWALVREKKAGTALRHAAAVCVFGVFCGTSILGPLIAFGAFNAHNDAFTYLVHANWLQEHVFSEVIKPENVTPLTTQVSMYQQEGFRMGASFLLALAQSLFNLRWSFEAYPTVMISAIASCCLAIGFPLAKSMRPLRRRTRLALLALPSFSLGGLVFGANLGFLPQTIGLALGAGLLFAVGPTLRWLTQSGLSFKEIAKSAVPAVLLLAAGVFAYSELAPFLVVAVVGSGLLLMFRSQQQQNLIWYMVLLFVLAGLLLNTELIRAYAALRTQSGAVVGSPVDWSLLGYAAHAVGVHGGAWDGFQWTTPDSMVTGFSILGFMLTGMVAAVLLAGSRAVGRAALSGELMPAILILLIFITGLIYFRYFVPSPFTKGVGQSWSQFKLADWAHPFAMALAILGAIELRQGLGRYFEAVVAMVFVLGLVSAVPIGLARAKPLIQYYGDTRDLNQFYHGFRQTVMASCPLTAPIYLALNGQHHKFRQMAVYYLADRMVSSDWTDDGYIFARLPVERRTQALNPGDCVVEPSGADGWLKRGTTIGPFRVGIFDGQGQIRIASVSGAYDQERDGDNWWRWVERKVIFELQPLFVSKEATQTRLRFEYGTRGSQTLTVRIRARGEVSRQFRLDAQEDSSAIFDKLIDIPPIEILEVSIESDGQVSPLGEQDTRVASWVIRNMTIAPASP